MINFLRNYFCQRKLFVKGRHVVPCMYIKSQSACQGWASCKIIVTHVHKIVHINKEEGESLGTRLVILSCPMWGYISIVCYAVNQMDYLVSNTRQCCGYTLHNNYDTIISMYQLLSKWLAIVVATQPDSRDWEYRKMSIMKYPWGNFQDVTIKSMRKNLQNNTTHNSNWSPAA